MQTLGDPCSLEGDGGRVLKRLKMRMHAVLEGVLPGRQRLTPLQMQMQAAQKKQVLLQQMVPEDQKDQYPNPVQIQLQGVQQQTKKKAVQQGVVVRRQRSCPPQQMLAVQQKVVMMVLV